MPLSQNVYYRGQWLPISAPRILGSWLGLGASNTKKSLTAPNSSIFAISLRKSERKRKAIIIWEEKEAPSAANDLKIPRKAARTEQKTTLKAVATGPLFKATKIDSTALLELPEYLPPLELYYKPSESIVIGLSELHTFQQLFI
jgi:hypothetical protein